MCCTWRLWASKVLPRRQCKTDDPNVFCKAEFWESVICSRWQWTMICYLQVFSCIMLSNQISVNIVNYFLQGMQCIIVNENVVRDKSVVVLFCELTICSLMMLRNLSSKGLTAGDIRWDNWQKSRTSWCDFHVLFLLKEYEGQEWVSWEGAGHIDIREYFWYSQKCLDPHS